MRKNNLPVLLLVLIVVSLACGSSSTSPSEESTVQALSDQIRQTGTAAALAETQAFSVDPAAAGTQTALALLGPDALTGTAQAYAPILAEPPTYGVDPAAGRVAWIHPPVSLEVEGYMQYEYINHFIATIMPNVQPTNIDRYLKLRPTQRVLFNRVNPV